MFNDYYAIIYAHIEFVYICMYVRTYVHNVYGAYLCMYLYAAY